MARLIPAALVATLVLFAGAAQAAGTLDVHLVSQTISTITLGWTPQPGYGYLFTADGLLRSRTNDPSRSTVRFSTSYSTFEVAVIAKGATGVYPGVQPPTPPPKNQCEDGIDNDGDGKIDYPADPGCSGPTDNDETNVTPPPATTITPTQFQTLAVRGATISNTTVTGSVTISNSNVTVTNSVIQGDVTIPYNTSSVLLQDVKLNNVTVGETALTPGQQPPGTPATDIVLRRVDGNQFVIGYALRVRILNGDWGPADKAPAVKVFNPWDPPAAVPVDVLIEGNLFHDITQPPNAEHVEGILIYAGNGVAVRNNRFVRCRGTGDLSVSFLHVNPYNPLIANVLVSGNQGSTEAGTNEDGGFFNVQYDGQIPNLTFTGNTFPKGMLNVDFVPSSGIRTASPPPNWPPPVGG